MDDLSILDTTKLQCGIEPDNTDYDVEIMAHINTVFFVFQQLGLGPEEGYLIFDKNAKWGDYIGMDQIAGVISLMGLRVRLLYDPPQTGPATEAMERRCTELEWRLNIHAEGVKWEEALKLYSLQKVSE